MRLTIPNILTIFRLCLAFVFLWLFSTEKLYFSLAIFAIAGFTDILDGYIARKKNLVTDFGKIADPAADKIMTVVVLACLAYSGRLHWFFLAFYFVKELLLTIGAINIYKKTKTEIQGSKFLGKLAMLLTFLGIASSFFGNSITPWHLVIMGAAVGVGIASFLDYREIYRDLCGRKK